MMRAKIVLFWSLLLSLIGAGCQESAVVFAPTPPPADISPMVFAHPSGAFHLNVPRTWAVFTQDSADLASSSFTPLTQNTPILSVAVIRLDSALDITSLLNQYQEMIRPDAADYKELERQAMGDGSWRLLGLRVPPGGESVSLNTFIQRTGDLLAVIEIVIPSSANRDDLLKEAEQAVNTLVLDEENTLTAVPLDTLSRANSADIRVTQVAAWTTPLGIYFITGEVTNTSDHPIGGIPIRVGLLRADGSEIVDGVDTIMGYSLAPGEFAPFSLRFGAGRPPDAAQYIVNIGTPGWNPIDSTPANIVSAESMTWTQESSVSPEGHLLVEGMVTNTSRETLYDPVAVITVFDTTQNVIAAAYTAVVEPQLAPGESAPYFFRVQEMGGTPANTIITVQAKTDAD